MAKVGKSEDCRSTIIYSGDSTVPFRISDPGYIPPLQQILKTLQVEIAMREHETAALVSQNANCKASCAGACRERKLQPCSGELAPEDSPGTSAGHRLRRSSELDRGDRQCGLAADRSGLAGGQAPLGQAVGGRRSVPVDGSLAGQVVRMDGIEATRQITSSRRRASSY